jgi:hypothetical protein
MIDRTLLFIIITIVLNIWKAGALPPFGGIGQTLGKAGQVNTLAASALGWFTGDLCADTFFPPGELIDFWGFQYLRDTDADEMGHNSNFAAKATYAVVNVLNTTQKMWLLDLAYAQAGQLGISSLSLANKTSATYDAAVYGRLPFQLAVRDARALNMNKTRVMAYSGEMYASMGRLAIERAKLYARLWKSLNSSQMTLLDSYTSFNHLPNKTVDSTASKVNGQWIGLLYGTFAGDFLAWYKGNSVADAYFAPERVASYFGLFYMKDIISLQMNAYGVSTTISSEITGDYGENLRNQLTNAQDWNMDHLLDLELPHAYQYYYARVNATRLLRQFLSVGYADEALILSLAREMGEHDGAISYYASMALNNISRSLDSTQLASFASIKQSGIPACSGYWYLSYNYPMPAVDPCFVTYFFGNNNCQSFYDVVLPPSGSLAINSVTSSVFLNGEISVSWSSSGTVGSLVGIYLYQGLSLAQELGTSATLASSFTDTISTSIKDFLKEGSYFRVKIVDLSFPSIFAFSTQIVVKGMISVNAPISTTSCVVGQDLSVSWTSYGIDTDNLAIYLYSSTVLKGTLATVSRGASGSIMVKIPQNILQGSDYTVRLVDLTDNTIYASSASFTIKGSILMSQPTISTVGYIGITNSVPIRWSYLGGNESSVAIHLYKGSTLVQVLARSVSALPSFFQGTPLANLTEGDDYSVVVKDFSDSSVKAQTPSFIIRGSITISNPFASTVYAGDVLTVTWTSVGMLNVAVSLYLGSLEKYKFPPVLASLQSYTIQLENSLLKSSNYWIKIQNAARPNTNTSSPRLTITGHITSVQAALVSPSLVFQVGGKVNVQWAYTGGSTTNFNLYLFKETVLQQTLGTKIAAKASPYPTIFASTLCSGYGYRFMLVDANDSSIYLYSATFAVKASITVSKPISGTVIKIGKTIDVAWTYAGLCSNATTKVSLDIYRSPTNKLNTLTTDTVKAIDGSWSGIVSATKFTQGPANVRVSNYADSTEFGVSANFNLGPASDDVSVGISWRKNPVRRNIERFFIFLVMNVAFACTVH